MTTTQSQNKRVVSGMRPTGALHLGNYHGALKNWIKLQHEYDCFFFVADLHALTTHYADPTELEDWVSEVIIDWLATGLSPGMATLFVQSKVPEHATLHLFLSMLTPLSWLERVPSFKDQQEKLREKDLSTYGFLGYPLLQAADILIYKPNFVPVGQDQDAHIELTREVARRFNHFYGREPGFEEKSEKAIKKLGARNAKLYRQMRNRYQEKGDTEALQTGQAILREHANLTVADQERLLGYLEGSGRTILIEPEVLHTESPVVPGLDGQKMSKSYRNTIGLREDPDSVVKKLRTMQTDPARVRRTDPGDPDKCPVWDLHGLYSDEKTRDWVREGCTSAGIGCLDCKKPLIEKIVAEIEGNRKRAEEYVQDPDFVRNVITEGNEKASDAARDTMDEVRQAVGLNYRL